MATETTYSEIAERTGFEIPEHLIAQAHPPVAFPGEAVMQGDVGLWPVETTLSGFRGVEVGATGINVVEGDVGRNSHNLNTADRGVWFARGTVADDERDIGLLVVPAGAQVALTHSGEHGSIIVDGGEDGGAWRVAGQLDPQTRARVAD